MLLQFSENWFRIQAVLESSPQQVASDDSETEMPNALKHFLYPDGSVVKEILYISNRANFLGELSMNGTFRDSKSVGMTPRHPRFRPYLARLASQSNGYWLFG